VLQDIIRYPTIPNLKPSKSSTEELPKAITGEVFRKYLEDKRAAKQAECDAKASRAKERADKKAKKLIDDEAKRERAKIRLEKKVQQSAYSQRQSETARISHIPVHLKDFCTTDDNDNEDEQGVTCIKCQSPYDDKPQEWIGCDYCGAWLHRSCTDLDWDGLSESDCNKLDFKCDFCNE